jgi:predicted nuclease of predicted toxin-antitoxin system
MTTRLILDEHYSAQIAQALRDRGHDVTAAVANDELRGASDPELYRHASEAGRRIVTENIKDFRPLLLAAIAAGSPAAALLLVPPRRFPRGRGDRNATIVSAISAWLVQPDGEPRPPEDWLT